MARVAADVEAGAGDDHAADVFADETPEVRFRKNSIMAGTETSVIPKLATSAKLNNSLVKKNVKDMVLFIQGSKNIKSMALPYVEENFPKDDPQAALAYHETFLVEFMIEVKPKLKFARWGATGRILFVLVMSYSDMVTDVLVILTFYAAGNMDAFGQSIGILSFAIFFHIVLALLKHSKRRRKAQLQGALQALLLLTPAIESYDYWRGREQTDDDIFDPVLFLVACRAVELVLESVPESVIQTAILFQTPPEDVAPLQVISIAASILAAGVIMTETCVTHFSELLPS
jgi:hypothetical protein